MIRSKPEHLITVLITLAAALAICFAAASLSVQAEEITYHENEKEAAAELREGMKQRKESVTIGVKGTTDQQGLQKAIGRIVSLATEHTGKPDEGDYLAFQYGYYKGKAHTSHDGGTPVVEIEYGLQYYDNAEQERAVDDKVKEIIAALDLENKTDPEKIAAIHDYICDNVEYEASEDGSNISRTAYGALVDGHAVCQGYCVSMYRLLLETGIDNRIIIGEGKSPFGTNGNHTWNIVQLYDEYYYMDVTWDDCTGGRSYFLVPAGAGFEDDHIPDDDYADDFFTVGYPIAGEASMKEIKNYAPKIVKFMKIIADTIVANQ